MTTAMKRMTDTKKQHSNPGTGGTIERSAQKTAFRRQLVSQTPERMNVERDEGRRNTGRPMEAVTRRVSAPGSTRNEIAKEFRRNRRGTTR